MQSEVDWKLDEQSGLEGCDQQHTDQMEDTGPILLNIFISDQDTGTVYTISKLTDIKPEGVVDTPDGYAVIQSDISSLEK